jgi:serine protease
MKNTQKSFRLSLLATALAIPLIHSSINAQTFIEKEQRFIVTFKKNTVNHLNKNQNQQINSTRNRQVFSSVATSINAEILQEIPSANVMAVMLNNKQKNALMKDRRVSSIEVDPKRYLFAESSPYGIAMVQANQLSDSGSVNQKVCIVDTGYTLNHEDLPSSGVTGDDGYGSNDTGNWYNDGNGHGTHVAGTVAAIGGNNKGVVGVNPSGKLGLHIVKVFNDQGNWAYGSDLIKAVSQCQASGATVISMSLGGGASSSAEQAAFDQAYASGILNVAAAGNDGNSTMSYPASYNSVMSVAAVDSSGTLANFSQYNSQVEIAAPGVNVQSTYNNGGYSSLSGTSMAAPHVSGVAALVWGNNPQCTVQQLRDGLNSTAEDKGSSGRDTRYGYGIIKAKAASDYLRNQCGTPPEDQFPVAGFSSSINGLSISFNDNSTDDKGVVSHSWNFGDGTSSTSKNPNHNYSADGSYSVSLTVTDTINQSNTVTKQLSVTDGVVVGDCAPAWSSSTNYTIGDTVSFNGFEYVSIWWSTGASPDIFSNVWKKLDKCDGTTDPIENQAPKSVFTYSLTDLSVAFTNSSTDDKGIVSQSWSFGDGNASSNEHPSHSYVSAGSYQVTLTVYDVEGLNQSSSQFITVTDGNNDNEVPTSSFTYNATDLSVAFTNNSTDDKGVVSQSWNFGDGSTASSNNPNHSYNTAGTYQVSLTVFDAEGLSQSSSQSVTVEDGNVNEGCDGISPWSLSTSYAIGDEVEYNGKKYEAIWWSRSAQPDVFSNVWKDTGSCQ